MNRAEEVRRSALGLSLEERAQLVDDLIGSIHAKEPDDVHQAWLREIEARLQAYDNGDMRTISLEESRRRTFGR